MRNKLVYIQTGLGEGKVLFDKELVAKVVNDGAYCIAIDCRGRTIEGTEREVFTVINSVKWRSVLGRNPLNVTTSHHRMEQKKTPSKKRFALS